MICWLIFSLFVTRTVCDTTKEIELSFRKISEREHCFELLSYFPGSLHSGVIVMIDSREVTQNLYISEFSVLTKLSIT